MLGTQTRGSRMGGTDESTELWRHPIWNFLENKFSGYILFQHLVTLYLQVGKGTEK